MTKLLQDYPLPKATKEEVKEWFDSLRDDRDLSLDKIAYENYDTSKPYKGYLLKAVAATGGSEGDGEYMDITYAIQKEYNCLDVLGYVQLYGRYNSWDSSEWDGFEVVEPKEVTRVEFS